MLGADLAIVFFMVWATRLKVLQKGSSRKLATFAVPVCMTIILLLAAIGLTKTRLPVVVTTVKNQEASAAVSVNREVHELTIHNIGDSSISVRGIPASCGVILPGFQPVEIKSGHKARLTIDLPAKKNLFRRDNLSLLIDQNGKLVERSFVFFR